MKKNKLLLILITLSIYGNSYAQLNNFNFSDYKLHDLERRVLESNFNLSGYNNYDKAGYKNNYGSEELGTNQYYGDIYINYNHFSPLLVLSPTIIGIPQLRSE